MPMRTIRKPIHLWPLGFNLFCLLVIFAVYMYYDISVPLALTIVAGNLIIATVQTLIDIQRAKYIRLRSAMRDNDHA